VSIFLLPLSVNFIIRERPMMRVVGQKLRARENMRRFVSPPLVVFLRGIDYDPSSARRSS
jgi:hypothetical protein